MQLSRAIRLFLSILACALMTALAVPGSAQEVDCLKCHASLTAGKKVRHPALDMGCPSCHSGIDAQKVPHKKTTTFSKGLSAEQPDLCYGCHDKAMFSKKHIHPAVAMGCTGCHDPHASQNEKLLVSAVPDLCFNCHDKGDFSRKNVHQPVAGGMCLTCHNPHSSDSTWLLNKDQLHLCTECHDQIVKGPHAISGFGGKGHPLGAPKMDKRTKELRPVEDPVRKGMPFACSSCHNPHSSDSIHLFRYPAKSSTELCVHCHKF